MKRPQNDYLTVTFLLVLILGAYVLAAYLDQQDAHTEQHQSTGETP